MTRDELINLHFDMNNNSREIMKSKNHDYTADGSPFSNFEMSIVIGIDPKLGLLLRVMDKIKRIETQIRKGKLEVKNEPVEDAILDIINYMVLLQGMFNDDQTKPLDRLISE